MNKNELVNHIEGLEERLKGLKILRSLTTDTFSCYDIRKLWGAETPAFLSNLDNYTLELKEAIGFFKSDLEEIETNDNQVKKLLSTYRFTELEKIKIKEQLKGITLHPNCYILMNSANDIYLDNYDYSVFLCNKEVSGL